MTTTIMNVPIVSAIRLDNDCVEIINDLEKWQRSDYVRKAIVAYAREKGFEKPTNYPNYMPSRKWHIMRELKQKSRRVDYSYIAAYYWLKKIFPYSSKSEIIREAIKNYRRPE